MSADMYRVGDWVSVNDSMQSGYRYCIAAPAGADFDPGFKPRFSPREMLELGVFEGKYCNDCAGELPEEWFAKAKIADRPDPSLNCFGIKSRQPLSEWRRKGWIIGEDGVDADEDGVVGRAQSHAVMACCGPGDPF